MSRSHPFAFAERQGREAFAAGQPIDANPYVGMVHSRTSKGWNLHREQAWNGGWERARFGRPPRYYKEVGCQLCRVGVDADGNVGGWVCRDHGDTGRARYDIPFNCTKSYGSRDGRCNIDPIEEGGAACPRCTKELPEPFCAGPCNHVSCATVRNRENLTYDCPHCTNGSQHGAGVCPTLEAKGR